MSDVSERLSKREPKVLAAFIVSLAQDSGPVDEHVRTFLAADDPAAVAVSVRERLNAIAGPSDYDHRHRKGEEVGPRLEFSLDTIETLLLPVDAASAFELLVLVIKRDGVAMEHCGDHDHSVACAFERAAALLKPASRSLADTVVEAAVKELMRHDLYGVRERLESAMPGQQSE